MPYRREPGKRWCPRLDIRNCVEVHRSESHFVVYTTNPTGDVELPSPVVCWRLNAFITFAQKYDLSAFPFDGQDLVVSLVSWHARPKGSLGVWLTPNLNPQYSSVVNEATPAHARARARCSKCAHTTRV